MMAARGSRATKSDARVIWLVHPFKGEPSRIAQLATLGYEVMGGPWSSPEIIRRKSKLPVAVVVDLSRSPSSGRDTAIAMRSNRELLKIPFLLIGGASEPLAVLKKLLPDAIQSSWEKIAPSLIAARAKPPSGARQLSVFAAYEGKSLAEKLGIRTGTIVATINAPAGLRATLGRLPDGAKVHSTAAERDLTLWFVRSIEELMTEIVSMKPRAASGRLWVLWRKGASSTGASAPNQNSIRKVVLANGLVDFRICRIDDEWAGLRLTIRK